MGGNVPFFSLATSLATCKAMHFSWATSAYATQFNLIPLFSATKPHANSNVIVSFNTLHFSYTCVYNFIMTSYIFFFVFTLYFQPFLSNLGPSNWQIFSSETSDFPKTLMLSPKPPNPLLMDKIVHVHLLFLACPWTIHYSKDQNNEHLASYRDFEKSCKLWVGNSTQIWHISKQHSLWKHISSSLPLLIKHVTWTCNDETNCNIETRSIHTQGVY